MRARSVIAEVAPALQGRPWLQSTFSTAQVVLHFEDVREILRAQFQDDVPGPGVTQVIVDHQFLAHGQRSIQTPQITDRRLVGVQPVSQLGVGYAKPILQLGEKPRLANHGLALNLVG